MESTPTQSKGFFGRFMDHLQSNRRRTGIYICLLLLFVISFFIPVDPPHVALSGEPIFAEGPSWLTNSLITTLVVDVIVILMALLATARMKLVPRGWQNVMEMLVEALYGLAESVAGRDARRFFPWVMTIFLFVIISNWSGLIPGVGSIGFYHTEEHHEEEEAPAEETAGPASLWDSQLAMADGSLSLSAPAALTAAEEEHKKFVPLFRAPSADLNTTFALAILTMVMVQVWGVRALGGKYFKKFFNFSGHGFMKGINGFVGILELISEISRVIAFGFRLFGNIFAGEIVLATMAFLITFLLPIPFYMLEIFVGFVQALVFMMLALVFFSMSTISHDPDHH